MTEHTPDSGSSTAHRPRKFTRSDVIAVADYLDDAILKRKSAPWLDILLEASAQKNKKDVGPHTIQRRMKEFENISTYKVAKIRALESSIQEARLEWVIKWIKKDSD
jgi:hypothetical protein